MSIGPSAIRVNAVLSAFRDDSSSDVIDALCYFFVPILDTISGKPITASFLAKAAKYVYGWNLTESVGEVFLERLASHGFLVGKMHNRETTYFAQANENLAREVDVSIRDAFEEVTALFQAFELVADNLMYRKLSQEELGDILVKFLISLDAYTNKSIAHELNVASKGNGERDNLKLLEKDTSILNSSETHICARFIQSLNSTNPELAKNLSVFVSAGLLAELVEDFRKPSTLETSSKTTFFLDGPMLLGLIGTSGTARREEAKTIVEALKSIGCQIQVFTESCREAERVLNAFLKAEAFERHGQTHTAVLKGEVTREFVKTVASDVERAAETYGIYIQNYQLESFQNQHKFFDSARLDDIYSFLGWENSQAREHDAFAVTAIMRMRGGKHKNDPLKNSHVFISSNQKLVSKARDYCIKSHLIRETQCGPIVDSRDLATIAWLRTGFDESEKIPISHMLAQCERVLRVRKDVVEAAQEQVAKYSPEKTEQFELLLQDNRAVNYLMDTARGTAAIFDPDRDQQLLDGMLEAAIKVVVDDTDRKISEKDKAISELKKKNHKTEKGLRQEQEKNLLTQQQEKAAIATKLEKLTASTERDQKELKTISERYEIVMAKSVRRTNFLISTIQIFAGLMLLSLGLSAFVGVLGEEPPKAAVYALNLFSVIGIIFAIQALRGRSVLGLTHLTEYLCAFWRILPPILTTLYH